MRSTLSSSINQHHSGVGEAMTMAVGEGEPRARAHTGLCYVRPKSCQTMGRERMYTVLGDYICIPHSF